MQAKTPGMLEDIRIYIKLRLSALWIAVMLCYIYGDIIGFYQPGNIPRIIAGKMGPLGSVIPGILTGVAIFMTVPAFMFFLSLILKPVIDRWTNIKLGIIYTVVMLITILMGAKPYYIFLGVVELVLTALVFAYAFR